MPMPPPFWHFCQFIGLPPALARRRWKALTHARWSEATAFRQAFGLTHGLADGIAAPRHTIVVVEALVQDKPRQNLRYISAEIN